MNDAVDVLVIGAGVSGLEAARHLYRAGMNVLIVEARPRIGGRIATQRPAGWPAPVEAGAEFVHGRPAILVQRLRASGARTVEIKPRHALVGRGEVHAAGRAWKQAQSWMARLPNEDAPYDDVIATAGRRRPPRPEVRRLLRGFVEGFNAADATRVSAKGLHQQTAASEAEQGDRLFRVVGGYDALPEHLARPLLAHGRVLLSVAVTTIRSGSRGIEAIVKGTWGGPPKKLTAKVALVTLPLGILQSRRGASAVRFEPPLPKAKRAAIARLAMGRVIKIVVRFHDRLGSGPLSNVAPSVNFLHLPRASVPTWWVPSPAPPNCLVGWIAGPAADRFASHHGSDAGRVRAAVEALARGLGVIPQALAGAVEDAFVFDWGRDEWARGAYCWEPQGTVDAPAALAAPVGDRLYFAGEATNTGGDLGTVHGALETGRRAAREIMRRFARS